MANPDNSITENISTQTEAQMNLPSIPAEYLNSEKTGVEQESPASTPSTEEKTISKGDIFIGKKDSNEPTTEQSNRAGYQLPLQIQENIVRVKNQEVTADDAVAILNRKINGAPIDID